MGFSAFEIEEWGPRKLREIHKQIAKEINERSPVEGLGIRISQDPTGRKIETATSTSTSDVQGGPSSGGGSNVNVYGSVNGAPALFHLLQSSPPTVPPPLE